MPSFSEVCLTATGRVSRRSRQRASEGCLAVLIGWPSLGTIHASGPRKCGRICRSSLGRIKPFCRRGFASGHGEKAFASNDFIEEGLWRRTWLC